MREVVELEQTSLACPSQWSGRLSNGDHLYVRYRWGGLSWGVGVTEKEAIKASMDCMSDIGGEYDGEMSTEEMQELLTTEFRFKVI